MPSPARGAARRRGSGAHVLALVALLLACPRAEAWQARLAGGGTGPGSALTAAFASNGDVFAGGYLDQDGTGTAFTVVRLDAAAGAERWRRTLLPGSGTIVAQYRASALVVDGAGAVIAAGTSGDGSSGLFTVVKLVGTTGAVAWRYDAPTVFGAALAVTVDEAGDVIAAGIASGITPGTPAENGAGLTVVKLAGATGAPAWTAQLELGFLIPRAVAVAVGADQDIIVAGNVPVGPFGAYPAPVVLRLDGTSGAEMWRTGLDLGCAPHLAVSPAGDVFAGAGTCDEGFFPPLGAATTVRLAGDTGEEIWSHSTRPVDAIALDDDGNALVVGSDAVFSTRCFGTTDFRVMRLARDDGTVLADRAFQGEPPCDIYICCAFGRGEGEAVTPSGDVLVAGVLGQLPNRFVTARLTGADLHEAWLRADPISHPVPGSFAGHAVVLGPGDRFAVPGTVGDPFPPTPSTSFSSIFSVLSLSAVDGALDACGDAVQDPGERCDDGILDGGCCVPDCSATVADGAACDDFDACTLGDQCTDGVCHGTMPLPCAPCGTCDPGAGCIADIQYDCKSPTTTNAATLVVERHGRTHRRLSWAMRSGAATARSEFGNPLESSDYAMCAYQQGRVVARAVAPAGRCGGRQCWHRTRRGFVYDDPRAPDGISHLALHAGNAGRTRIRVAARGAHLLAPDLPVDQDGDVLIEVRRTDDRAACWSADHGVFVKNRSDLFRAKGN